MLIRNINSKHNYVGSIDASGGTENLYGAYKSHAFTSSGTFTTTEGLMDIFVLGGGAGVAFGMMDHGGGGGAGAFIEFSQELITAGSYSITIGDGGKGGWRPGNMRGDDGDDGSSSTFQGLTSASGGGGGGGMGNMDGYPSPGNGSGGGGMAYMGSAGSSGAYGNDGGSGSNGGGGGGAGSAGGNGSGGSGSSNSYRTGSGITYAEGGDTPLSSYVDGGANTGTGGSGGDGMNMIEGGNGGSGIVVIRYLV